ncbi:HET-domain-containing protein [Stipitochalara longipes BDJ]|nr:HET-domain-containing protein [Stipitochalara longipes BDJ]
MSTPNIPLLPDYLPGKFIASYSNDENVDAIPQPDRLCTWCESIKELVKKELPGAQKEWKNGKYSRDSRVGVKLSFDKQPAGHEVALSARKGCHLCSLAWHSVQGHLERNRLGPEEMLQQKFYGIYMDVWYSSTWGEWHITLAFDLGFFTQPHPSYEDFKDGICLDFLKPGEPSSVSIAALPTSTAASATFQWLDEKLKECLSTHSECKAYSQNSTYLPTRVIDVGASTNTPSGKVYLVYPAIENRQGPYTTLSYCWGGEQNSSLTTANLQAYRDPLVGIDISTLPKTLQDAIVVTRRLGIRFLWVDSLCILQDDPTDWRREAATMCHVYQNSYLTIAALKSTTSAGGLFAARNPLVFQPGWLFEDAGGNAGAVYLHTQIDSIANSLMEAPLRKRAWVFQELALSPRIVYYADLMVYQCCIGAKSDMTCGDIREDGGNQFLQMFCSPTLCRQMPSSVLESRDHEHFVILWFYAIHFYTSANLTEPDDRQIAISGVIQSIGNRIGFRNIAGLWEPTFMYHLMWGNLQKGPRNGNAPSWSWFSMDGPIAYDESIDFVSKLDRYQTVASLCQTPAVRQEYDVGKRRTRLVGHAILSACPLRILSMVSPTSEKRDCDVVIDSLPPSPSPCIKDNEVHLDCESIPTDTSNLYFLPLLFGTSGSDPNICHQIGLIVERLSQEPDVYQRVGCILTYENDRKADRKADLERYRKTITLV